MPQVIVPRWTGRCTKCGRVIAFTRQGAANFKRWGLEQHVMLATPEVLRRHKCEHGVWCISCLQQHKAQGAA